MQQEQHQICQPEQLGGQQVNQQMVLCPVRVVYETQVLMPQGDQMQPNQTIFLNPNNPPPWMQNRVQNQVIYVQQMPNNIVQSIPQHIDQNQLMQLQQNFANYQQIIPQQLIQNQELMRTQMPISNMMPNMIPNMANMVQANMIQNMQNPNERFVQALPNVGTNMVQNTQQNAAQNVNVNVNANQNMPNNVREVNHMIQRNVNDVNNYRAQDIQVQYRAVAPNVVQQIPRHHMPQLVMNPLPPTANLQQVVANVGQVPPSMGQPRPMQTQNMPNTSQPTQVSIGNMTNVQYRPKVMQTEGKVAPVNSGVNVQPRNVAPAYGYRPIQPRPQHQQARASSPNFSSMGVQTHPPMQTVNAVRPHVNVNHKHTNYINPPAKLEHKSQHYVKNVIADMQLNRKRKTASPDDQPKKMTTDSESQTNNVPKMPPLSQINTPVTRTNRIVINVTSNVGVNTSPRHRMEMKTTFSQQDVITTQPDIKQQMMKPPDLQSAMTVTKLPDITDAVNDKKESSDKEKLVRNTVYTQARGRLISDKAPNVNISMEKEAKIETRPLDMPVIGNCISEDLQPAVIKASMYINTEDSNMETPKIETHKFAIPKFEAPKYEAPKYEAPKYEVPKYEAPKYEAPKYEPPKFERYTYEVPKSEASKVETPKLEAPKIETPKLEAPKIETPKLEAPKIETLKLESPKFEASKIETHKFASPKRESPRRESHKSESKSVQKIKEQAKIREEKPETPKKDLKVEERKETESEINDKREATFIKDMKSQEMRLTQGNREERDYVLTHVLGGFVIQESNVAFPIRRPLKERVIQINSQAILASLDDKENEVKEDSKEDRKEPEGSTVKEDKESKQSKAVEEILKENPFSSVHKSTVKSWTVEDLTQHLSKFEWSETVILLQEQEIDGESLFLVSKSQLIDIGMKEDHATLICDFIKA